MTILLKKMLGSLVRYGWTALFASPFVIHYFVVIFGDSLLTEIKALGDPNGPIVVWLTGAILAIIPLFWSWYQKAIEVAKRWIAAHMAPTTLPGTEEAAKSYSAVDKVRIAVGKDGSLDKLRAKGVA